MISSVTTRRASSHNDQFANPFGGGFNRVAITFASCSPGSSFDRNFGWRR
jgi:hypothetical protein